MNNIKKMLKSVLNLSTKINKDYSNFLDKHKVLYIFPKNLYIFLLFIILSVYYGNAVINNKVVVHQIENLGGIVNEIYKDEVKGNIDTKKIKKIDDFGIYVATYRRKNDSKYRFELYKDDKKIKAINFNPKNYKDNTVKYFNVNIKIDKDSKYTFKVIPVKVTKDKAITLIKDGKKLAYEIVNVSDFYVLTIVLSIIFLIIFFIINYLININKINNQNAFLLSMFVYILPILFIIPPYEIPDEGYHFVKAYKLSQYDFSKNVNINMKKKKLIVPKNLNCIYYSVHNNNNVQTKNSIAKCFKNEKNKKIFHDSFTGTDKLFVAIPSAIGIKIVDSFTNAPILIFYIGRVIMLVISFIILYHAIKIAPKYKNVLLLVGLMPMFVQQMASYSYDSVLNSLCLLQIAYYIKFYNQKDKISKKDLIIYFISSCAIFIIKAPYVLLSALIFFIDENKFGNKKAKIKKIIYFVLIIVFVYLFSKLISNIGYFEYKSHKPKEIRGNSLTELFKNPKLLLWIVYDTLSNYFFKYLDELIGVLGQLKYHFINIYIIVYYVFLVLYTFSEKNIFSKKNRIINIATILLIIGGIFFVMYLQWTPTGHLCIDGVQGRYFLPILPLLILMLTPKKKKITLNDNTVYSYLNVSLFTTVLLIMISFY